MQDPTEDPKGTRAHIRQKEQCSCSFQTHDWIGLGEVSPEETPQPLIYMIEIIISLWAVKKQNTQ